MAKTIALEFRHENGALAANGTDVITYLDGRWNASSQAENIRKDIERLRKWRGKYNNQEFVGYTTLGVNYSGREPQVRMADPNPPAWAK